MMLPAGVKNEIARVMGAVQSIDKLSGIQAGGGCYRVGCENGVVCVKRTSVRAAECLSAISASGGGADMPVPKLLFVIEAEAGDCWLGMEYIPYELPGSRWRADAQVIRALYHLHSLPAASAQAADYKPRWPDSLTESALEMLARAGAGVPMHALSSLQERAALLFRPACLLHGDPNPTNWRMRADGGLVLVDWDRVCAAHPALDLAITMPGLGSEDGGLERRIAESYNQLAKRQAVLPEQIELAKIWSVIEYLGAEEADLDSAQRARYLVSLHKKILGFLSRYTG